MITCSCHLCIDVDKGPLTTNLLSSEVDGRDFHITCMENWTLMFCMKFKIVKLQGQVGNVLKGLAVGLWFYSSRI